MSEEKKSFMQELDLWIDANVVGPLMTADPNLDADWEDAAARVKQAIRQKVLDSYHNGQQAGPRAFKQPQRGGR